jgi:IS30 family transposase
LLDQRWSPEQICRALPLQHPNRPELRLTPESIYQAVYRPGRAGLADAELAPLRDDAQHRQE